MDKTDERRNRRRKRSNSKERDGVKNKKKKKEQEGSRSSSGSSKERLKNQDNRDNKRQERQSSCLEEYEFRKCCKFLDSPKKMKYVRVKEICEDLFKMPKEYALAHCVAEDMHMGRGIAVQFRNIFNHRDELYQQEQKPGGLAILCVEQRFIYYLVTKKKSTGKPTLYNLWCSLRKLKKHIKKHKVAKLAIPRIGCGLDRLKWSQVKPMLEYIFQNTNVIITVCNFKQNDGKTKSSPYKSLNKLQ